MMRKIAALIVSLLSPLLLPAPLALIAVFGAAVILPPVGILAGVFADALYKTPATPFPLATILGALVTLAGYIVHRFVKTRIMGA
jgi:hypothetical protein